MSLVSQLVPIGLDLVALGVEAARGQLQADNAARRLVDIGLQLVPYETLKAHLTRAGIERGELLADIAEEAKFDSGDIDDPDADP